MTSPFRLLFAGVTAVSLLGACDIRVDDGKLSVGVSRGRATDQWTRTYTVAKGGRLEISNENGPIEATASPGAQIVVKATREVRDSSEEAARARLATLKMREDVSADHVSIGAEGQDGVGLNFNRGYSVHYEVQVPAGLTVSLKTMNGTVRLDDLQGQITASTTNGGVTGTNLSGSVQASTVNGGVQMDLASVSGDMKMSSVNGGVRVQLPAAVNADIDATTVNGRVSVDDRFSLSGTNSQGSGFGARPTSISGRINKGGPRLSLQTTNGGVRVSLRGSADEPEGR